MLFVEIMFPRVHLSLGEKRPQSARAILIHIDAVLRILIHHGAVPEITPILIHSDAVPRTPR